MPTIIKGRIRVRGMRTAAGGIARATVVRRYGKAKLSKPVRRAVKTIMSRQQEVKHTGQNVVNAAFNQTISSASECYRLLPDVTPGDEGNQRIGNKIRPRYLIVKGHVQYDSSITGDYVPPNTVRVMIMTQRNIKVSTDVSSRVDTAHLLKDNINTDVGRAYTAGLFDNLAPINKETFNVLMDRKFKLREHIVAGLGTTGITVVQGTQRTFTFYKKIKCPATLYFDDQNVNTPNNFAPFICMGGVNDDGTSPFTIGTPYRLTVQSELYFTDA